MWGKTAKSVSIRKLYDQRLCSQGWMRIEGFFVQQISHHSHNLLPKFSLTRCGLLWENDSDVYTVRACWDVVEWEIKPEPEQKVEDQCRGAPAKLSGPRWRPWLQLLFSQDARRHHDESVNRKAVFIMQEHTLMQAICLSLDFKDEALLSGNKQQGPSGIQSALVIHGIHCLLLITEAESTAAETCT